EAGSVRAAAREAIDKIVEDLRHPGTPAAAQAAALQSGEAEVGSRVTVGGLGLEGIVISIDGNRAEIDVRGKRIQAKVKELRVISGPSQQAPSKVRVNVDLKPREGMLSE